MTKNIDELYEKWDNMMDLVFSRRLGIDAGRYPSRLDSKIQRASELKRQGKFENAIEIYLDIFETEGRIYIGILDIMYPSAVCSGRIDFAYEVIAYGEAFYRKAGGYLSPFISRRKELEQILIQCHELPSQYLTNGDPTDEQIKMMCDNETKKFNIFDNFMTKYAEGADITVPTNKNEYLLRSYQLYSMFRRNGIIQ